MLRRIQRLAVLRLIILINSEIKTKKKKKEFRVHAELHSNKA